jgi:phosphoglycerol transferase MdoB-like AlkP superfamily enzyme
MKKRVTAIILYTLFWILFFFTARFIFILSHFREASQFGSGTLAATFLHGIKLDISATGYILIIPVLLVITCIFFYGKWYRIIMRWYTYIIIVVSSCIVVSDVLLYKYWGFRMDYTVMLYLKTPKEAMASVTTIEFLEVLSGIILLIALFIILYRKTLDKRFDALPPLKYRLAAVLFFLVLWGSLIIPIRGGFGLAPINAGAVYFSEDMFVNHTAINVVWNVGSSVIHKKPSTNPYNYGDFNSAKALADSLTSDMGPSVKILNNTRPNIIFIVLESFGNTMIGPLGGDSLVTPNFNRFIKKGVLFSNFYASGNRTDKAMPAILNGYPAQPAASIMKEPRKTQSLPGLVKAIGNLGYDCAFWYGGEINFANFNSFIINSGFRQIISKNNFNPEYYNSKWGVHDNILFEALRDSMKNVKEPFLKVVLTLSSHEPFDVPMETVFGGNDDLTKFKNSIYYTDNTLGSFLDWAETTNWWKNTLIVLVADHCRRNSGEDLVYSERIYRIPMLWLGGAISEHGIRIEKTGSQVDIPLTILHQMDLEGNYPFSKDLLSGTSKSFAFYTFNEGFGFITDSSKYIFDHKLGRPVLEEGKDPETAGNFGKAYLQVLYEDFLKR